MDISVIIPVLNEAGRIGPLIEQVRSCFKEEEIQGEVIVVDGGSIDDTCQQSTLADQVIQTDPGRARQLNMGAEAARNSTLLFLHADCQLYPGCLSEIAAVLNEKKVVAGCFTQLIDGESTWYRVLEWGNRQRTQWLGWAYGDQGLFLRRKVFEEVNRFPEVPFLEDLLLSKKLSRRGKIGIAQAKIGVSARRWQQKGVLRQTVKNWTIIMLAQLGASPHWLKRFYPHVR